MAIGDSYYITHDIDAFDDIKIIALCDEFGLEAYALYWLILEKMFPEESISLPYSDMTFRALKAKSKASCDIKSLIDRAIEYELFALEDGQFFSPSFVRRMEKHLDRKAKRSEAGRKGGKASAKARKQKKESQASANESSSKNEAMLNDCQSKRQADVKQNQANEIEMKRNEIEMKRNELVVDDKSSTCSERSCDLSEPETDSFIDLPLNNKTMFAVTTEDVKQYGELYPSVNVEQELRNMRGWLDANPDKRKTPRGIRRFVNGWLAREQDRGGSYPSNKPRKAEPPRDYSQGKDFIDLLKEREQREAMNAAQ